MILKKKEGFCVQHQFSFSFKLYRRCEDYLDSVMFFFVQNNFFAGSNKYFFLFFFTLH